MQAEDTYFSISGKSDGLFKDNGSRFIALAYPVGCESEIKDIVASLKKEYHDARHHCYAWRLGLEGDRFRANDDGEPSGSAGRQILGQIDSAGLSDVLVVVVRYFGGIKLGIPGLIRAYRTATADALSSAERIEKVAGRDYSVEFEYEQIPALMKLLKSMNLQPSNRDFTSSCRMNLRVRLSSDQDFFDGMQKIGIFKNKIQLL